MRKPRARRGVKERRSDQIDNRYGFEELRATLAPMPAPG